MVLIIPVAPNNREARDIIRNTWGKDMTVLGQMVSHYFLLGKSTEENETDVQTDVSCLFNYPRIVIMCVCAQMSCSRSNAI